jgi:hypothetical protein
MKKFTPLFIVITLCLCSLSYGQNSFPASGTVGIGTLSPDTNYALDVNGNLKASEIFVTQLNVTDLFVNGSQVQGTPWNLNGNNVFYSSGNVGIGTNNPNFALDIAGTLNATNILVNGTPLEGSPSPWTTSGSDISYTEGNVDVTTLNATNINLDGSTLVSSPWTISGSDISFTTGDIDVATLNASEILLNGTPLENSESPWTTLGSDISYTDGDVDVTTLNATNINLDGSTLVSSPWTISGSDISFTTGDIEVTTLNASEILLNGTPLENSESPWTTLGSDISYTDGDVDVTTLNATNINLDGSTLVSSPWTISGSDISFTTGDIDVATLNASEILLNGTPLENSESPWTTTGNDLFYNTGNVGIGTNNTQGYMFAVAGNMIAEGVKVELMGNWPDFVFEKNFDLLSLKDIERYIEENGHLPHVPSAEEIKRNGIDLGGMDATLLQKIEELTLYTIEQQKEIDSLKALNLKLWNQNKLIKSLEKRLLKIESKQ